MRVVIQFILIIFNRLFQNICLQLYTLLNISKLMKENKIFTPMQRYVLLALRLLIGWHILYEGFSKLLIPNWSSLGFLNESKWILSGFSHWIISHPGLLSAVDFLNTWGLIAIGTGLILGLFTRVAALSGAILLFVYYLNNPPLIGLEYSVPTEGNYLIISKTLIESVTLVAIAVFPSGLFAGLDIIVYRFRDRNKKEE